MVCVGRELGVGHWPASGHEWCRWDARSRTPRRACKLTVGRPSHFETCAPSHAVFFSIKNAFTSSACEATRINGLWFLSWCTIFFIFQQQTPLNCKHQREMSFNAGLGMSSMEELAIFPESSHPSDALPPQLDSSWAWAPNSNTLCAHHDFTPSAPLTFEKIVAEGSNTSRAADGSVLAGNELARMMANGLTF